MTTETWALDYTPAKRGSAARPGSAASSLLVVGLVAADFLSLAVAFVAAYLLRFEADLPWLDPLPQRLEFYWWVIYWAVPIWLGIFLLNRLYDLRHLLVGFDEYTRVAAACTAGTMAVIVISFFDITIIISRGWLLLVWLASIAAVCSSRFTVRRVVRGLRRRGHLTASALIVGANGEGRELGEQLLGNPGCGVRVVGFVDNWAPRGTSVLGDLAVLGSLADLREVVERDGVTEIVVATSALTREELLELYRVFGHDDGVELRLSSGLFEILTTGMTIRELGGAALMTPQRVRITGINAVLKGVLDYAGAALGLLALSPLLLIIALLVKLDSRGPVVHRRIVLGQAGKAFHAFKFRTMMPDRRRGQVPITFADRRRSAKSERDPRITRIGAFLRRTSLDELPQLLNVLRGEMSLIGPRMISPEEAALYGKWRLNLLTVKPGITGPWQVRGRCSIPYEERVRLSMQYIRNYSIWLDLEILLRTLPAVLSGRGAY